MQKIISLVVLLWLTQSCVAQEDCSRFRSGKYAFRDSAGTILEIKRTTSHQTEFNPKTKLKIKFRIDWNGSCEYKLTQVWASTSERRKWNKTSQTFTILSSTENTYEYSCTCADDKKVAGVVVKTDWFQ